MKKILPMIVALAFLVVTACSTPPATLVKPDFTLSPRVKLDVATVSVVDRSGLPTADSTPESKEFKAMILASVRKWAASNVVPVGTYGEAIVVVRDASLTSQAIAHDDDWFSRPQTTKYIGHVEVEINVTGVDSLREQATAQAVRYETLPDAPTVDERLGVYYRLIEGINKDLDLNLNASMREHLASFILPGTSQIAEGTGKQNVMQAYPRGGQPYPLPGMPYQPAKAPEGQSSSAPPSMDTPKQPPMTAQYDATYVPIPLEEFDSSKKSIAKPIKKPALPKQGKSDLAWDIAPTYESAAFSKRQSKLEPQSLGVIPKPVGSSVVLPQPSASLNAYVPEKTASLVGGYGTLPVYEQGQAPTTLKPPAHTPTPMPSAPPSSERLTGNVMGLPAPVIIQGSLQDQPRQAGAPPVSAPQAGSVYDPNPRMPMGATPLNATSQAKPEQQAPDSGHVSESGAPYATPTPPAPTEPMDRANLAPSNEPRTKTVVGAGGRIRTIVEQGTPKPPSPDPGSSAASSEATKHPTEAIRPLPSAPEPMSLSAKIKKDDSSDKTLLQEPTKDTSPRPQETVAPPPRTQASESMRQPTQAALSPPQQTIAFPSESRPPQIRHPANHEGSIAPSSTPTGAIYAPPPEPLRADSTAPMVLPSPSNAPPASSGRIANAPAKAAVVSPPQLPPPYPILNAQDTPCPVATTGSSAAYGSNCAAGYSAPTSYPPLPYVVD